MDDLDENRFNPRYNDASSTFGKNFLSLELVLTIKRFSFVNSSLGTTEKFF